MNRPYFRVLSGVVMVVTALAMGVPRPTLLRAQCNLAWTPDVLPTQAPPPGIPPIDPNGPPLVTALQEQLGLKLVSARAPVDVLVIDSVEHPAAD